MVDTPDTKAKIAAVEALRQFYVPYDLLESIKQDLTDLVNRDHGASEGACMLLTGPTRSGKTKFLADFMSDYPCEPKAIRYENGEIWHRKPVVYAKVPDATPKGIAAAVYRALMGVYPPQGPKYDTLNLITDAARKMGVRLFILDEMHEAIEQKTARIAHDVAVFVKNLANEGLYAVLVVGTDEAKRLLQANDELRERTPIVRELGAFDWDIPSQREVFVDLLAEFDKFLEPVFGTLSDLKAPQIAIRIHLASGGVLGIAATLVEFAGVIAVRSMAAGQSQGITMKHLAVAFQNKKGNDGRPNPFEVANVAALVSNRPTPPPVLSAPPPKRVRKRRADVGRELAT